MNHEVGTEHAGPHGGVPPLLAGAPLDQAPYALVLVHGRGGSAEGMLPIARAAKANDAALVAPVAVGNSWYPKRFLDPREQNAPWLSSALARGSRGAGKSAAVLPFPPGLGTSPRCRPGP